MKLRSIIIWTAVAVVGAAGWAVLALSRGENVNAVWLLCAALGSYAIAYRFYARFIVRKVLRADDRRATPAERLDNGIDYHPTDRRILFGHHFAAIRSPEPLPTTEAPFQESTIVAPSGLIATREEKELMAKPG